MSDTKRKKNPEPSERERALALVAKAKDRYRRTGRRTALSIEDFRRAFAALDRMDGRDDY